jgi:alkylhydroperoxidase/carboxymuconolactone decarboxylase family protein YurZ
MEHDYPEQYRTLQRLTSRLTAESPEILQSLARVYELGMREGVLEARFKHLLALAIGIASHSDAGIARCTHDALTAGATREHIIETIEVACIMGGELSLLYGGEALHAVEQWHSDREFAHTRR